MNKLNSRLIIKVAIIAISLGIIGFYGIFQAKTFLTGPTLTITSPVNGEAISSTTPEITVKGTAKNISFITINGLQIFTDEKGDFSRALLLSLGYNIITIEVQDKFKRTVSKELQLILK